MSMKRNTGAAEKIVTEGLSQERLSLECIRLFDTYFYNILSFFANGVVIVLAEFRCVNVAVQQSIENSLTKASSLPIEMYIQ